MAKSPPPSGGLDLWRAPRHHRARARGIRVPSRRDDRVPLEKTHRLPDLTLPLLSTPTQAVDVEKVKVDVVDAPSARRSRRRICTRI